MLKNPIKKGFFIVYKWTKVQKVDSPKSEGLRFPLYLVS
jgi:hypothetical protein